MSIQKALPVLVPDGFYQIKKMPFIGSARSTAFFTTVLYCLSVLVFSGLIYFYGSDSQSMNETVVTTEWDLDGYDSCNPLQGDPRYNSFKNYPTCLKDTTLNLNTSNLVSSTESKSIDPSEYIRSGFTCKPKQIDDYYGVKASFEECVEFSDNRTVNPSELIELYSGDPNSLNFPQYTKLTASDGASGDEFGYSVALDGSTALVGTRSDDDSTGSVYVFSSQGTLVYRDYDPIRYEDFACNSTLGICAAPCYGFAPFSDLNCSTSIQTSVLNSVSDSCDDTGISVKDGTKYCTTNLSKAVAYFDCRKNAIGATTLCEFTKSNAPFECTAPCYDYAPFANGVSIDATILTSVPDSTCDTTGYSVKDFSKYCTNLDITTASNYFECRANAIGVEAICEFTKSNAPYECQRKIPLPPLQRLSLAYANTLILYSALASLFAGYLYRVASKSCISSSFLPSPTEEERNKAEPQKKQSFMKTLSFMGGSKSRNNDEIEGEEGSDDEEKNETKK